MKKNTLIILLLITSITLGVLFIQRTQWVDVVLIPATSILAVQAIVFPPERLFIPKLDISVPVEDVGVTDTGEMATPEDPTQVGWYASGTIPGDEGSAVIAGHLDNYKGEDLVFARLSELVPGDSVYILNDVGKPLHFEVMGSTIYPYDATSTEAVFGPAEDARLNLITCEGEWIQAVKSYSERLVVFTRLKS